MRNNTKSHCLSRPRPRVELIGFQSVHLLWAACILSLPGAILFMMTSSNGNIFRVTGPLWGGFTGHRWIPHTKASDVELWFFSLICAWTNGWVNNQDAGELRCHHAHYDVSVVSYVGLNLSHHCICKWPSNKSPIEKCCHHKWKKSIQWKYFCIYKDQWCLHSSMNWVINGLCNKFSTKSLPVPHFC